MVLKKQGQYRYGEAQADIRDELRRYSKLNGYEAEHFADAVCRCERSVFGLSLDDTAGAAVRTCRSCGLVHPIGDSADFLAEAAVEECACPCGAEELEITVGVSLYAESADVRWLYLGCRCPKCGLTAVYGDWKNEFSGFQELLARV